MDKILGLKEVETFHEIKWCLLLGRKVMTKLDSILKSRDRDITLPTKVHLVKAMIFPVVMYGCESWTIKKAECLRINAFELWCWRTLESPLDCKEIQPVHPKGDQSWVLIGRIAMTNLDSIKKQQHHFADIGLSSQSYDFSSSHVWMWELDYKESCVK